MTDISTQSYSWGVRSGLWLASSHGTNCNDSYTFDSTGAVEAEHYPDGWLVDGTPLGAVTLSPGVYKIWNKAATDGTQVLAGFAYDCPLVKVNGVVRQYVGGALTVHGFVVLAQLKRGFVNRTLDATLVAAVAADLPKMIIPRNAQG